MIEYFYGCLQAASSDRLKADVCTLEEAFANYIASGLTGTSLDSAAAGRARSRGGACDFWVAVRKRVDQYRVRPSCPGRADGCRRLGQHSPKRLVCKRALQRFARDSAAVFGQLARRANAGDDVGVAAQCRRSKVDAERIGDVGQNKGYRAESHEFRCEIQRHRDGLVLPRDARANRPLLGTFRRRKAEVDVELVWRMLRVDGLLLIDGNRSDVAVRIPGCAYRLKMALAKNPFGEKPAQVTTRGFFNRSHEIDRLDASLRVLTDVLGDSAPKARLSELAAQQ